ncbi:MAG: DUF58 domain-containing protein [Chloroflexota bacterium]|nr:DUF58 domain-containing protein [Chloroflexota bacterium]MDE2909397.1 DUF58 domain-containing protein [Chloroflexota bacterium]
MPNRRNALYILAIFSLLAGLFTGRAELFNIAYLIAAVMILSLIWTWLSLRGIGLRRTTRTRRSQVGRVFQESFGLRKTGILPKLWLEIRDHSTLPGHQASHVAPTLLRNREYTWDVETVCSVRGEFQLGPMTVVSGDPFGLFYSPRRVGATDRLIVYPMTVEIGRVILPVGFLSGGDAQRQLTHQITTNASSIRDYVSGDSMNRIHWRSTARTGNIMVKEFELDPLVDIWLLNDFSAESLCEDPSLRRSGRNGNMIASPNRIPPSTEEYGVVVAASLAKHFIDDERVVGYAAYTPYRQVFQPERGNRQLTRILEALASARSSPNHRLKDALSLETHLFTRGTTLIMITSSVDQDWISEAQILQRRGIRLICIYINPQTFSAGRDSNAIRGMLQLAKIPTIVISKDDDLAAALEQRPV